MATASLPPLTPEYINAYNGGPLWGASIALIPIQIFFVGLRFYSRYLHKTKLGVDDHLVLVSLVLNVATSIVCLCSILYGGCGYHVLALEETNPAAILIFLKLEFATNILYIFVIATTKLAILAMILRVLVGRPYIIAAWATIALLVLNFLVEFSSIFWLCQPSSYFWTQVVDPDGGFCLDINLMYRLVSLPNLVIDVMILLIPVPLVKRVHIEKRQKIVLYATFATGGIGIIAAIVRAVVFFQTDAVTDATWTGTSLKTWTEIEPFFYLIAACLPTYRPLIKRVASTRAISTITSRFGREAGDSSIVMTASRKSGTNQDRKSWASPKSPRFQFLEEGRDGRPVSGQRGSVAPSAPPRAYDAFYQSRGSSNMIHEV